MDYKVVTETANDKNQVPHLISSMERKITALLNDGWELHGNLTVSSSIAATPNGIHFSITYSRELVKK